MAKKAGTKATTKAPTRQMWKRSMAVLAILVICWVGVTGKLSVIQIAEADFWREKAVEQQMSDSIISPKRGTIYDAKMTVLA